MIQAGGEQLHLQINAKLWILETPSLATRRAATRREKQSPLQTDDINGQHKAATQGTLVERGSLIQHPKSIHPGSTSNSGSMVGIGPGSSRKAIGPGSFRTFRPGSWHEPGPKEATSFGPGSWHKPGSKGPSLVPVHTTNRD